MGALVGAVAGAVFSLAHLVFPVTLALVLATAASLWATGAFHGPGEDGFADACDGLGGGADREQALEIMRDSRLGAYGAAGLGLMLAAKVLALAAAPAVKAERRSPVRAPAVVIPWLLVAAHAASRASAVLAIATGSYVRAAGAAKPVADGVARGGLTLALATGAVAVGGLTARPATRRARMFASPVVTIAGLAGLAAGHLAMRGVYERKLGGYTGDCLGAVQQTSELGLYLGAVAVL